MLNEQQTRIPFILSAPGVAMPDGDRPRRHARDHPARRRRADRRRRRRRRSSNISARSTGPARSAWSTAAGRRIVFNFFEETVWTSGADRWARYADLAPASAGRRAADALHRRMGAPALAAPPARAAANCSVGGRIDLDVGLDVGPVAVEHAAPEQQEQDDEHGDQQHHRDDRAAAAAAAVVTITSFSSAIDTLLNSLSARQRSAAAACSACGCAHAPRP